jgi:hypothetical protein
MYSVAPIVLGRDPIYSSEKPNRLCDITILSMKKVSPREAKELAQVNLGK